MTIEAMTSFGPALSLDLGLHVSKGEGQAFSNGAVVGAIEAPRVTEQEGERTYDLPMAGICVRYREWK
jgi:creatinine amidohydrolase/Fe(II)-dependent formamide hydrolase-like protein